MTEITDIKALQRPTRKNHDWSKAVWTDCDHCGEAHTGTVLADDGARICAGCSDAEYYSAWQTLAEAALDQLEAERQRREAAEAELAALREGKEPYAYALDTNGICSYLTKNKSEAELHKRTRVEGTQVIELFTRPVNPVVVLPANAHIHSNWGAEYLSKSDVLEMLSTAQIVVKDGE